MYNLLQCGWRLNSSLKICHCTCYCSNPRGPYSQILMTGWGGGGGSDRGSYFKPQKITTSEFVYPKKSLVFLAYPKNIPLFFFATKKNPGIFHRPKKIILGQNFGPQKITRTPPSQRFRPSRFSRKPPVFRDCFRPPIFASKPPVFCFLRKRVKFVILIL